MAFELKKLAGISAVAIALSAAPALAQDHEGWDTDGDGAWSQDEFNQGWSSSRSDGNSAYSMWDEDGDGSLTEDEFNTGVYNSYDKDRSGAIEEPEFGDAGDDMGDGGFWDI